MPKKIHQAGQPDPAEQHRMAQAVMTDEHFNWILGREVEIVRRMWLENPTNEPLLPQINIWGKWRGDEDYVVIPMGYSDWYQAGLTTGEMVYNAGKLFGNNPATKKFGAAAVFMVSEARVSNAVTGASEPTECLMVIGRTIDGRANLISVPIFRPEEESKTLANAPMIHKPYSSITPDDGGQAVINQFWKGYAWGVAQAKGKEIIT